MLEAIPRKRIAMISGWAVDPNAIYRYQVDTAFPLSDHADYTDLIRYVELVRPRRVFTLHGFAVEFARDLRERGVEAWALNKENQMELRLGSAGILPAAAGSPQRIRPAADMLPANPGKTSREAVRQNPGQSGQHARAPESESEFFAFADVGERIGATPAKLEKIRLLADYLRTLDEEQLPIATTYFTGRAFPQSDLRTLQVRFDAQNVLNRQQWVGDRKSVV